MAPRPIVKWPANVVRLKCHGCGKHLENIVPKTDAPIQAVVFRMCKCGHYNVIDLEMERL